MASELPPKVEPIDGAEVVEYPWGEAASALAAIDDASAQWLAFDDRGQAADDIQDLIEGRD